jgi:hypothetical protein
MHALPVPCNRSGISWLYDWLAAGRPEGNHGAAFLEGNFAPVNCEVGPQPLDEVVDGTIPMELDGVYVRTGPNPALPIVGR